MEIVGNTIYNIDCLSGLKRLADNFVQCCVTSPPYWRLRDYGVTDQLGSERIPEDYIRALIRILKEVKRVLKDDGTLWLNIGDVYWGSGKLSNSKTSKNKAKYGKPTNGKHRYIKTKDLVGLPWKVAFALQKQGWYLRQDIIWHKINPMPESVTDRCCKAHEYIFLLSKSQKYYFDHKAIKTPVKGKTLHDRTSRITRKGLSDKLINGFRKVGGPYHTANRRSVWSIVTKPFMGNHTAAFPPELPELCIKAGSRVDDIILDPFMGAGTTALVASALGRQYIGFELNPDYVKLAEERIRKFQSAG